MMLTSLKYGGQWEIMAKVFGLKGPPFEQTMTRFIDLLSQSLYHALVMRILSVFAFPDLHQEGKQFKHFPAASYVTDVTFQQAN